MCTSVHVLVFVCVCVCEWIYAAILTNIKRELGHILFSAANKNRLIHKGPVLPKFVKYSFKICKKQTNTLVFMSCTALYDDVMT